MKLVVIKHNEFHMSEKMAESSTVVSDNFIDL